MISETVSVLPGYKDFSNELGTLLTTHPPQFIYIQDTEDIRTTSKAVSMLLREMKPTVSSSSNSPTICYAQVDCVASFTARLLYESIINTLVGWEPHWQDGCGNWNSDLDIRWNENMGAFIHGLRAAHAHLTQQAGSADEGKGKAKEDNLPHVRLVIVIERVERLKESLPELLVPFTRLGELSKLDLSMIFLSQVGWEDIRPPFGASPDPYYLDISSPSKGDIARNLVTNFTKLCNELPPTSPFRKSYHPALKSLYTHFITTLCDVCYPFTHNPQELQYIAAARWPGFCQPLLDEYKKYEEDGDVDMESGEVEFASPSDDVRMRLMKVFNPTLNTALEGLLPRLTNAADWARANEPPANLLSLPRAQGVQSVTSSQPEITLSTLPRMSKFILIASFLASTNPANSDLRMFGRGLDEKKRKRRATKALGKPKGGGSSKVPQHLLGPASFPLDRMIAILGALLEEHDVETRLYERHLTIPGEHTDMEIGRVGVFSSVMELTSMRLLHRTTPADRLDGPPQFKCAISHGMAEVLAKESLNTKLNELLWDTM